MLFEMRFTDDMLELYRGNDDDDGPPLYGRLSGDESIFCFHTSKRFIVSGLSELGGPDLSVNRCSVLSRDRLELERGLLIALFVNLAR